jgi:hypothetical protein
VKANLSIHPDLLEYHSIFRLAKIIILIKGLTLVSCYKDKIAGRQVSPDAEGRNIYFLSVDKYYYGQFLENFFRKIEECKTK